MIRDNTLELDDRLKDVADSLDRGETVKLTRNGAVLGHIVPAKSQPHAPTAKQLADYLENFGRNHSRGDLTVRQMRDEGRS